MLELIDFLNSKLKTFNFDELDRLNFKNPIAYKAFGLMSELNKACKIKLADFQFDRHNLFYLDKKGFKNHLNEIIYKTRGQQSSNSLRRVVENNFSFSNLEYLEKEQNPNKAEKQYSDTQFYFGRNENSTSQEAVPIMHGWREANVASFLKTLRF